MKLRISPLNFATAFFIVLAFITWLYKPVAITGVQFTQWTGTISLIFLLFALVISFLDLMFRNYFLQNKMLWMVELSFIAFTAVIYLLVR